MTELADLSTNSSSWLFALLALVSALNCFIGLVKLSLRKKRLLTLLAKRSRSYVIRSRVSATGKSKTAVGSTLWKSGKEAHII